MMNLLTKYKYRIIKVFFIIKAILSGSKTYGSITIYGQKEFLDLTIRTLDLLKEKHPAAFTLVQRYIEFICFSKFSVIDIKRKFCLVCSSILSESEVEYAGGLVHEAFHCKLYYEYLQARPEEKKVPKEIATGEEAEKRCVEYQCKVLEDLGADQTTLDYYKNVINTRYWEVPWEFQDW